VGLVITIAVWVHEGNLSLSIFWIIRKKKGFETYKKIYVGWIDLGDHLRLSQKSFSYSLIVLGFHKSLSLTSVHIGF